MSFVVVSAIFAVYVLFFGLPRRVQPQLAIDGDPYMIGRVDGYDADTGERQEEVTYGSLEEEANSKIR